MWVTLLCIHTSKGTFAVELKHSLLMLKLVARRATGLPGSPRHMVPRSSNLKPVNGRPHQHSFIHARNPATRAHTLEISNREAKRGSRHSLYFEARQISACQLIQPVYHEVFYLGQHSFAVAGVDIQRTREHRDGHGLLCVVAGRQGNRCGIITFFLGCLGIQAHMQKTTESALISLLVEGGNTVRSRRTGA